MPKIVKYEILKEKDAEGGGSEEYKKMKHLTILSVGTLLAEAIKRIHSGESVGALFT